jgi:hypothetical protein
MEDSSGNIIDQRQELKFGKIISESSTIELIDQKTWKSKLKRKWMKTRKVLIQ